MSIEIAVYMPDFSCDIVTRALKLLSEQGIDIELEPDLTAEDPNDWEGFIPMKVDISRFRKEVLPKFSTGLEVDIEPFRYNAEDDLFDENTCAEIQRKVKLSSKVVTIYAGSQPAAFALLNAVGAALAESSGGALFDSEAGEFADELQALSAILTSDLVEQFNELSHEDLDG